MGANPFLLFRCPMSDVPCPLFLLSSRMPKARPRLKIIRRFGVQLPGLTRKDAEKKPYPPGQHGQSKTGRRKTSEFRRLLEEKQKVRFNYGVSEGQLRRYMGLARN